LKIAMIGQKRIPSREGGIEIVVEEISKRLVQRGHAVHAYNRRGHHISGKENDGENIKEYEGIRIITIPTLNSKKFNAIVYTILATTRAVFGRYDVIHFHAEGPCSMVWLPKLFQIRTVATIHGLDWQRSKWGGFATRFLKFGEKMAARYADEVIVLSKNVQQYFMKTYGRQTQYIPNGISKPEIKEVNQIYNKFSLKKDDYILFLARIVPEKGLHYLIDAFYKLDTDKKLVVAGSSSHTDEYTIKVRNQAIGDDRIIFTGFVQGEELDELFSNAFLYVLPSDLEGMPISLLEAMSYGNCCLVSDIYENVEVVEKNAICFEKGSADSLKNELEMLLQKPDIVEMYKARASSYICAKYNWDDVVDHTLKIYEKVNNEDISN
jgi:glycosyltransferase involved in cell wall biosynthesis